jgi:hypothetical protein
MEFAHLLALIPFSGVLAPLGGNTFDKQPARRPIPSPALDGVCGDA